MRAAWFLLFLGCGSPAVDVEPDAQPIDAMSSDASAFADAEVERDAEAAPDAAPGTDAEPVDATIDAGTVSPLCNGVTCDGHGSCVEIQGRATCVCEDGYATNISGQVCVPSAGTPCDGVDCGANGACGISGIGYPECVCIPPLMPYGNGCIDERRIGCRASDGSFSSRGTVRCSQSDTFLEVCADGDGDGLSEWIMGDDCAGFASCSAGCANINCMERPCPPGTSCVLEAHEMPLGVCVTTCDCSNCSNCGPDNSDGRWDDQQEYCDAPGANAPANDCNLPCRNSGDGCIPYQPWICWPIEGCFSAAE